MQERLQLRVGLKDIFMWPQRSNSLNLSHKRAKI